MQIGKNNFYLKLVGNPNKSEYQIVLEIKDNIIIFENEDLINKVKNDLVTSMIKDIVLRHIKELTDMAMKADPTINSNNVLLITIGGFSLKISANKISDYEKSIFNDILDNIFDVLEKNVGSLIYSNKDKVFKKNDYEEAKLLVDEIANNNINYEDAINTNINKEVLIKAIDEKIDSLYN